MTIASRYARPLVESHDTYPSTTVTGAPDTIQDLTSLAPGTAAWMTIVIPTRNEQHGVGQLLAQLGGTSKGIPIEVLFVDDSTDETPAAIRQAAQTCGLAVRLLHRSAGQRAGGLGGAVVEGLRHARGSWAVVMDADLQHPPELATRLVSIGQARHLDLVAGTRHLEGGGTSGLVGGYRTLVSAGATRLAKALFPRRLSRLSDPMSGFFAVRLAALDLDRLDPIGFKVLLEIAVRQHPLRIAEMPFVFGLRLADESKARPVEGLRFLHHLARLRLAVLRDRLTGSSAVRRRTFFTHMVAFGLVGVTGIGVNSASLWLFSQVWHLQYVLGAVLATELSTSWNIALTELVVFRGPKPGSLAGRGLRMALINHVALLLRLPVLAILVEVIGLTPVLGNLLTLVLTFVIRFVVADSAIYAQPEQRIKPQTLEPLPAQHTESMRVVVNSGAARPAARPKHAYLPYRYLVDGIGTVGSQVPLEELEYFRAQWLDSNFDLAIRVDSVGRGMPSRRATMTQYLSPPALTYQEHLGRLGANFRVEMSDTIHVTCSPSLARSPHVLYTNVIEALLRFVAVSRGVILLHSACLEIDGHGLLLSARTDTGKTGTVLRLLREHNAHFLSDDMTVLDPTGRGSCFPKPLTISHHTLRAVQAGELTPGEWRRLRLQSRLHSKEGRNVGMVLAGLNIPIMGVNSLTQRLVPPPKYPVDRLVDCRTIRTTQVEDLFVIERGEPQVGDLSYVETLQTLVENTDDAYGFPPFRQMAPSMIIGGDDYLELRRKERAILASALTGMRTRRVVTPDFSWADRIPELLQATAERGMTA